MKKIILLAAFILTSACTVGSYNTPFIDSKETTQLQFGLSRTEVIRAVGKPIFVDSGGDGMVVWVYEVRTNLVASDLSPTGESIPVKTNSKIRHNPPIHQLALVFKNEQLVSWGNYDSFNPTHEYGFYNNCYESGGCEGDIDECGNCQPPMVEEISEEIKEETKTAKCCGDNLYIINSDGTIVTEENK